MSRRRSALLVLVSATALGVLGLGPAPVPAQAAACPAPGGARVAEAPAPASGAIAVYGHGWGHGMGMSQWGAQGAAKLGCGYRTILGTYYRNTSVVTKAPDAHVLLTLATASPGAKVDAETGIVRWTVPGRKIVQPRGTTWKVSRVKGGLGLLDEDGDRRLTVARGKVLRAKHAGVVVTVHPTGSSSGLRTRWDRTEFVDAAAGTAVTQVIGATSGYTAVQKYLMGLAEVPVSWPVEALKAQTVAARTYLASKYSAARGGYVLSTTASDQVYRGFDQEENDARLGSPWRGAVQATKGQVIVDGAGRVIEAMYSSSMGGYTENRQYVYGKYGITYLKAVDDSRWDNASGNPYRNWSKGFTKADFAKRFGFDSVSSYSVAARGDGDRLSGVKITGKKDGKAKTVWFTGSAARSKLGLRSPGFTFGR